MHAFPKPKKKFATSVDQDAISKKKNLRAVAVKYDLERDRAPKIIANGKGSMAKEILRLAEEHRIPMYEDPTLVELLSKLEVDREIPAELYTLVAEVLAFVYQIDRIAKKKSGLQAALRAKK